MQTDMRLSQADHAGVCPLCNTPLSMQNIPHTHSQHASVMVVCTSCGFSGQFVQRQSIESYAERAQGSTTSERSSVWIDPTVEAYLKGHIVEAASSHIPPHIAQKKYPQPDPNTPIPPRASAQPQQQKSMKVTPKPKYPRGSTTSIEDNDVTRIPTLPPPSMWEYETPDYAVESSLPSLSLVTDAPTRPATTEALVEPLQYGADIDEIDTQPPQPGQPLTDVDKVDTLPPPSQKAHARNDELDALSSSAKIQQAMARLNPHEVPTRAIIPVAPQTVRAQAMNVLAQRCELLPGSGDASASWTAGGAASSPYARRITERNNKRPVKYNFHLLDHLRWWLLRPGRIEFLLWLVGTIILLGVTFTLLLVMAISMAWITPSQQQGNSAAIIAPGTDNSPISISNAGLTLTLLDRGPLVASQFLHVQGQGFSARGRVTFTDERKQPIVDQDTQSNALQADNHGTFIAILHITNWTAGQHMLVVRDVTSGHAVRLPILQASGHFGKKVTPTAAVWQPGATATQNSGSGAFPTPVNSTPVPPKPSPVTTPPVRPTPTQPSITPTASATVGSTPTVTPGTTPGAGGTPSPPKS